MKKSLVVLFVLAFAASAAMADPIVDVRYNTAVSSGVCAAGASCSVNGALNQTTMVFTSGTGDTVTLTYFGQGNPFSGPTYADAFIGSTGVSGAQFGAFSVTTTGNHGTSGLSDAVGLLNGAVFNITINQVLPSSGTGHLTAAFQGQISVSPVGQVTFTLSTDNTVIGDIFYHTSADSYGLNNSTGQLTSIDGTVATPEPASLALLGSGMIGLAGTLRRKLKA